VQIVTLMCTPFTLLWPDKGAGRSKWIAILLAAALIGWMGSGYIIPSEPAEEVSAEADVRLVSVAVMQSQAQDIDLVLTAEGQATPDRASSIQAKASGQIQSVLVGRGDLVEAGQELGRLDSETYEAQLAQAQAQLTQADNDLTRSETLQARGITTENQVMQTRAARAAASAAVTAAQEILDNTIIRAPFAGRLNEMTLDVGEFVNRDDVVAEVLDNDPLIVVVQVPQQALARLRKDQEAEVSFITGETRVGTGMARGHFISPAILSLGTSGELGIKVVDENDAVVFQSVEIVRAQTDGVWVTGLDETAQIITVGQGFVTAGDIVDPRPTADTAAEAAQ